MLFEGEHDLVHHSPGCARLSVVEAKTQASRRKSSGPQSPLRRWLRKLAKPAAILGIISGLATFVASYAEKVRVGNLEIVSKQLEKLYGPVYAVAQADEATWSRFRDQYMSSRLGSPAWGTPSEAGAGVYGPLCVKFRADKRVGEQDGALSKDFASSSTSRNQQDYRRNSKPNEVTEWRTSIKNVFQPMNVRMEQAIVGNLHLVIGRLFSDPFWNWSRTRRVTRLW